MNAEEENYVNYWSLARKKWSWSKKFMTAVQNFAVPFVILIHLTNFFIIGDVSYAFLSFRHLLQFLINLLFASIFSGFAYGFYHWNINERKYRKILKKDRLEI